jgi:hypothetical protein
MRDELKNDWEDNRDFNTYFDDNNEKEQIALEHHGALNTPSEVFFALSPNAYKESVADWKNENLNRALGGEVFYEDLYKQNYRRFNEILKITRRNRLIPFVGAGLSKPCNYPTWHEYLTQLADRAKNRDSILELIANNELDEAADALMSDLDTARFNEFSDSIFGEDHEVCGAVKYLPKISHSCVITSNFDNVIERTFIDDFKQFAQVVNGNIENDFHRALASGDRQLLKTHGQIKDTSSRVFCKSEYKKAYEKDDGTLDFNKPLPNILSRVFRNYCILFVGCGLHNDKTMSLFRKVVEEDGEESLPRHYAIVEAPNKLENAEEKRVLHEREDFLCKHQIFPIWFPLGMYPNVEEILACLSDEFYQ